MIVRRPAGVACRAMAGSGMAETSASRAGGAFLALAILAGAVIGSLRGQPTIGVLAGTGAGVSIALALWLLDRRRQGL
jgi:hypothetical protein